MNSIKQIYVIRVQNWTQIEGFYPSSKTRYNCGEIKDWLFLSERVFCCEKYPHQIDRDLNAAKNLKKIDQAMAELTPVDKKAPTPFEEAESFI